MADVVLDPNLPLDNTLALDLGNDDQGNKGNRQPKRILHFSDGILEEYSSDESEEDASPIKTRVDPSMLTWTPWCLYYITMVAQKSLTAAELCGEKLAWFFGITAPKYGYALEEYKRIEKEIAMEQDQKLYEESQGLSTIEIQVRGGKKPTATHISETSSPDIINETEKY